MISDFGASDSDSRRKKYGGGSSFLWPRRWKMSEFFVLRAEQVESGGVFVLRTGKSEEPPSIYGDRPPHFRLSRTPLLSSVRSSTHASEQRIEDGEFLRSSGEDRKLKLGGFFYLRHRKSKIKGSSKVGVGFFEDGVFFEEGEFFELSRIFEEPPAFEDPSPSSFFHSENQRTPAIFDFRSRRLSRRSSLWCKSCFQRPAQEGCLPSSWG